MVRNNDNEEYIRSKYEKFTKMSLEQINYIKNMQLISSEVIIDEKLNKIINNIFKDVERELKLLQTFEQTGVTKVYKQIGVGAYEFIGFDLGNDVDKTDIKIVTPFGIINTKNIK